MLHNHSVGAVDVLLICDHRADGRVAEEAILRILPGKMRHGVELAGRYRTADEAVAGRFFKDHASVFAEEFDQIGRASLAVLVFGFDLGELARTALGNFGCTVGENS